MELKEIRYGDRGWIKLVQNRVQWRASVLMVLDLRLVLPQWELTLYISVFILSRVRVTKDGV
jgi:hypothetical protein